MSYNDIEFEVITLSATIDFIDSMVNRQNLIVFDDAEDPFNQEVQPKHYHSVLMFYFYMLDFLSPPGKLLKRNHNDLASHIDALKRVCCKPAFNHNNSIGLLQSAVGELDVWINGTAVIREVYLADLKINVDAFRIKRNDLIYLYGNVSKHCVTRLDVVTRRVQQALNENGINGVSDDDVLISLDDIVENILERTSFYHINVISDMMSNVRRGISSYLYDEALRTTSDRAALGGPVPYKYPENLSSKFAQRCYHRILSASPSLLVSVKKSFWDHY